MIKRADKTDDRMAWAGDRYGNGNIWGSGCSAGTWKRGKTAIQGPAGKLGLFYKARLFETIPLKLMESSEIVFELDFLTLFKIFATDQIVIVRRIETLGNVSLLSKDFRQLCCSQDWCIDWSWQKSPYPTKGMKTSTMFSICSADVDKDGPKLFNVKTRQEINCYHKVISRTVKSKGTL